MVMTQSPLWLAQRHGQNWCDSDVRAAIAWMTEPLDGQAWKRRLDQTRFFFEAACRNWAEGDRTPLFDSRDLAAWYVFQSNAYGEAKLRHEWYEPEAFRIAPIFKRIGQVLPDLAKIEGAQARAAKILTAGRQQPDDGLFELLVAAAYKRQGWDKVAFVPEIRGGPRTHDIDASHGRRRWAIECKRIGRSGYASREFARGQTLAAPVHKLCKDSRRSIVVEVKYKTELSAVDNNYLVEHASIYLSDPKRDRWDDDTAQGQCREVGVALRTVLSADDVFFGSSRMIQLAAGSYNAQADHDVAGDWHPSEGRPFHAHAVNQLSIVSWLSSSFAAAQQKAKHFKQVIAGAVGQFPRDRPSVVHVGYELTSGNGADFWRDHLNREEMRTFDPQGSRLRYVYGNYMLPEHTISPNESSALTETTATYPVGRPSTLGPLPLHFLFSDGEVTPGGYWDK